MEASKDEGEDVGSDIKIEYHAVEKALGTLKKSGQGVMQPILVNDIGQNALDVVTRMHHLNGWLERLAMDYQQVLLKNVSAASEAVETMREVDRKMGTSIQSAR